MISVSALSLINCPKSRDFKTSAILLLRNVVKALSNVPCFTEALDKRICAATYASLKGANDSSV